ncbi:DNA topoisomerase IB [Leeuwenhoekiella polynyae]|uniref:DNA topoisomerase n=1 Tax=Leeuwenhoekiella polynyae TaxID=1550906 RepID=A0A4Q0P629_9FLAO|nr:DNA topoisomerase IB [Leeuwenhoekiella polynyae]RXG21845.1 DNA topoisomerase-1 [Leeuwenhoekiella polynyae]
MTITEAKLKTILNSPEEAAHVANLIYVTDEHLTICRKKHGKGFTYCQNDKTIKSKALLKRIKKLVIPPAWEDVLIAEPENGHLQAVGRDDKDRKVYLYHETWNKLRNETKFLKQASFANILPALRKQVDQDLDAEEMTKRKVLALVIRLLEETHIRVGNDFYAKRNKTYGLSTLRTRHIKTTESDIRFQFVGKKGKEHNIAVTDPQLIELINECEEIPGWDLFQFYDSDGTKDHIDSGMVNDYIHELSGDLFSAKDFRTWAASKIFFETLRDIGYEKEENQNAKNILTAYDTTAKELGNTRSVCRDYYVHPVMPEAYQDGSIVKYFNMVDAIQLKRDAYLSQTEEVIKEMLGNYQISI